jgi:hypothetical protein
LTFYENPISLPKFTVSKSASARSDLSLAGFLFGNAMVYSVRLDRSAVLPTASCAVPMPAVGATAGPRPASSDPLNRAKQLTKPFAGDDALDNWAARMIAAADDFQNRKRPDPLGGFLR